MSTKKDQPAENEVREKPKEPRFIPGNSDLPGSRRGGISEVHGDVRKGQKVPKLED